jgi:hypothetical protein
MKILVHYFLMGDVDEPELYASHPLDTWQKSSKAKWLKQNSKVELTYTIKPDPINWGYLVEIFAELDQKCLTYYNLKWGTNK